MARMPSISPRKEKYNKTPTGKYLVPHKRISRVNPNRGKQGGIPKKESLGIANHKVDPSCHKKELIPRFQRDNANEDPSWRQKELILTGQQKQRGLPGKNLWGFSFPKEIRVGAKIK